MLLWSSVVANSSFTNEYDLPDNILTAAGGNIVLLSDGKTIERGISSSAAGRSNAELSAYLTDNVFKLVGSNQEITNADNNYENVTLGTSFTPDVNYTRGGNLWIERQLTIGPNNGNRLLAMIDIGGQYQGIPAINIGTKQKVVAATNSIIIGEQEEADSIGNTEDCMNTIIMGKNKKIDINTSIIGGSRNEVFGLSNTTQRNIGIAISDATGNSPYHNNSIIFGNNNKIRGTQNYVFGQHNKVGEQTSGGINDNLVFNSFIAGQNNSIKKQTADNLDANGAALKPIDNETYVLLGSKANIDLNPTSNTSDVRFAFGTATQNGNVFTIDKNGNVVVGNDLNVNGEVSIGNVTLGSDASDTITISGSTNIQTDLTPDAAQTVNIGKTTNRFNNVYLKTNSVIDFGGDTTLTHSTGNLTLNTKLTGDIDVSGGTLTLADDQISGDKVEGGTIGSVTISQLAGAMDCNNKTMTNVDIDSGNIDGATISTSDITVGAGKSLDVSTGTLTLADDQISGDKINGGTIGSVTISQLAGAMDCNSQTMTNVDIDSGNIDGATIATSDITVGTGKSLDVSAGTLTLADDQISGDKINGGTIGSVTISQLAGAMDCNSQTMTNVDIDSGNIDGATIATSDITVGTGKSLDVSAGTLTLADDQISGDKINGGTIGSVTISQLAGAMDCNSQTMTNVDIDSGNIDGATIATSDITVGTGKSLDVSAGTLITSSIQKKAILEGASSDINFGNFKLSHAAPTANGHSATKKYVDDEIANITGGGGGGGGGGTSVNKANNISGGAANQIPYQFATDDTRFSAGLTFNGSNTLTCANFAGNASTATKLATAITIAGQSFDGSGNITIASTNLTDSNSLVTTARTVAGKALSSDITIASGDLTDSNSLVTTARTVAGKALSSDITIASGDLTDSNSLVTTTRTVAGKALSSNITIASSDLSDFSGSVTPGSNYTVKVDAGTAFTLSDGTTGTFGAFSFVIDLSGLGKLVQLT